MTVAEVGTRVPDFGTRAREERASVAVADRDRVATNGVATKAVASKARRAADAAVDEAALERIQQRILWLATRMIHEANHVRPNSDGLKIGGHQASSASMVSILTALYLRWLRAGDLVAVKPHSSPAYHSLQYLLGELD